MMNLTAISLTLLWNSPIYCICSDSSSFCRSKCAELGYYYLPNDKSMFKSLIENINREVTFVLIPNIKSEEPFFVSLPYYIFYDRSITLTSYKKERINVNLEIDTNSFIFDKYFSQKRNPIKKGVINLINVDIIFSLSDTKLNNYISSIEFDSLSIINSSLKLFQSNKAINLRSEKLFIDDTSMKQIITNHLYINSISDSAKFFHNSINLPFTFVELNFVLTNPSNIILLNYSDFSFSSSDLIYDDDIYSSQKFFSFNLSCEKILLTQLESEDSIKDFNISVLINRMPSHISCDFTRIDSANINVLIKYENETNIANKFDINAGSNKINIVSYSPNQNVPSSSLFPPQTSSSIFQFFSTTNFTCSSVFSSTDLFLDNDSNYSVDDFSFSQSSFFTESAILDFTETPNPEPTQNDLDFDSSSSNQEESDISNFQTETDYSSDFGLYSEYIPSPTPTSTPKPFNSDYPFEPFFFIDGDCNIFVDSIPIADVLNYSQSLKSFIINYHSLDNLDELFKKIAESPYQTVSVIIDLNEDIPLIIPPSIFYHKSYHILSSRANQTVIFENSNFTIGTYQNFTNIIVTTTSKPGLNFSSLCLHNSYINCFFRCDSLNIDCLSLELQKSNNVSEDDEDDRNVPIMKNIYVEIPMNFQIEVYPVDRCILVNNMTFEFPYESIETIFIVTNGNVSVSFEQMNNETDVNPSERVNFTFIMNENYIQSETTITIYNTENITEELRRFTIDSRSSFVNVVSVGFEFSIENSIRLIGDLSVSFNSLNSLFYTSYCICDDDGGDKFDCLNVCEPKMGPILPFKEEIISSTVELIPMEYLNFTIFGSTKENNPHFECRLFNRTSLDIQAGRYKERTSVKEDDDDEDDEEDEEHAYLTLKTSETAVVPDRNVVYKLNNLCFIIAPPNNYTKNLYLNFATAFFSSLTFIIPDDSTLTISSEAIDTDVLTLLKFPSNLIFTSPTQMCNISCGTIISRIVILSNQQIDLGSEEYNISYKLDLSLLLHMPANISCQYGTSKAAALKIMLNEEQPKSLADIPDLRFDVSHISGDCFYVEFPDQWNSNIEDVSSKIEIFHSDKTLYVQGKVVDDVYTTTPPTIFHNGAGYLYINGILSTFKSKYCICDDNITDCQPLCKSIGPIVSFDQESITSTVKSNPTRHITYIIFNSSPDWRPYFRLNDFAVKSFTISSEIVQFIDLETAPSTPVVSLNHNFMMLSIRPIAYNETADMKFYHLHVENSQFDCTNSDSYDLTSSCSLSQISLTIDLESAYSLSKFDLLSPAQSLTIIGKRSVSKVVMESKASIDVSSLENVEMKVRFNLSELLPKDSAVSITTLLGSQNNSKAMLNVELPAHEIAYEEIPKIKFDLTQVDGTNCFMLFPTSSWTGDLSNLTEKLTVLYGRHDFYQESSKHDDKYDGVPPFITAIGSGGYYINGVLHSSNIVKTPSKPIQRPFKSLGPSAIAGIVVGSVAFVVIVVGVVIIVVNRIRNKKDKSVSEQTPELAKQVNLGLVEQFSDLNDE